MAGATTSAAVFCQGHRLCPGDSSNRPCLASLTGQGDLGVPRPCRPALLLRVRVQQTRSVRLALLPASLTGNPARDRPPTSHHCGPWIGQGRPTSPPGSSAVLVCLLPSAAPPKHGGRPWRRLLCLSACSPARRTTLAG